MIAAALAAPALLLVPRRPAAAMAGADPFTLGVASGDPAPDGFVLWTRLAPDPLAPDGGMAAADVPVRWQVAEDEGFARVAAEGTGVARAAEAHSVHVEPRGLPAGRPYFYRFLAGGLASPVGRTRTAPPSHAVPDRLRLLFASCQKYEVGRYGAWAHAAAEEPDLIFFLGDYIYENKPTPGSLRPHPTPEARDLASYRQRYASYKLDTQLQAAHAAAPWVLTWDDHEVANDYGDFRNQYNEDPATFLRRRAAAYRAYWEHQPLRRAQHPHGPAAHLYRQLGWGRLARFQILDDRQYRGPRPCQPAGLAPGAHYQELVAPDCPTLAAPYRTMLGRAQERWLDAALARTDARWNLLAQQTLMSREYRLDDKHPELGRRLSADNWSGWPAARDRIFRRWAEARTPNPLALGGDIHAFAAADIRDPARPDGPPIASEFVGGSITSLFHDASYKALAARNGLAFAENEVHGSGRADIAADGIDLRFRGLADATRADTPIRDIARFEVAAGRPGLRLA